MRILPQAGAAPHDAAPKLELTSLIDVVFLLLIFFVMTFQVTAVEGDFPLDAARPAAAAPPAPPRTQTLHVRLVARDDGSLAQVFFGERPLSGVDALQAEIQQLVQRRLQHGEQTDDLSVELHCDPRLHYRDAIDALAAVRSEQTAAGRTAPPIQNVRLR